MVGQSELDIGDVLDDGDDVLQFECVQQGGLCRILRRHGDGNDGDVHDPVADKRGPRDFGYRRPTWTQELLTKVLREQTDVGISRTTMSRLLKRWRVRLGRPKPIVGCPWKKARKTRRLNVIRRLIRGLPAREVAVYIDEVDIHLNPKIGPDWMLCGEQKTVLTPGKNEKRYVAGALDAKTGKLVWVEAERKNSDLFIVLLWRLAKEYPQRAADSCDSRQLSNSRQPTHPLCRGGAGRQGRTPLPAALLPRPQPDRARMERSTRQRHPKPPLQGYAATHARSRCLPSTTKASLTAPVRQAKGRVIACSRNHEILFSSG